METPRRGSAAARSLSGLRVRPRRWDPACATNLAGEATKPGESLRPRELGARARSFAEAHYSPGAWARRLEALYEEAIEG